MREQSLAAEIHRTALIVEGHRDAYEQIHKLNLGHVAPIHECIVPRLRQGGVDAVFYAIGGDTITHSNGTDRPLRATLENLDHFYRELVRPDLVIRLVQRGEDLPEAPDGSIYFILHLEGGSPLEGGISQLRIFHRLGVRSMQLTWNLRNELGDGVRERDTGGRLTRFGVAVVEEMERLSMLIDLSHLSEAGFWHVMEVARGPVMVSHANCRSAFDHPRNLSDEQIRAIAERGGVVGVHFLPAYVDPDRPTVDRLVDHIDHICRLVGDDHVAIGPDFVKNDGPRSPREKRFARKQEHLDGLEEVEDLPVLTAALLRRGYSAAQVCKILGGNLARLIRTVLR